MRTSRKEVFDLVFLGGENIDRRSNHQSPAEKRIHTAPNRKRVRRLASGDPLCYLRQKQEPADTGTDRGDYRETDGSGF
nr:MAG TPA: hypothetical protein [Caudoviricetes sp.]